MKSVSSGRAAALLLSAIGWGFIHQVGSAVTPSSAKNAAGSRFNLILITIDTLRPDRLSCYGGRQLQTPSIDSLAERGLVFSRAFAHSTTTLPSHANILLGLTPLRHGVHDNANFRVDQSFLALAEFLKQFGYSTAAFVGGFPLASRFGLNQGFDLYNDEFEGLTSSKQVYREQKAEVVVDRSLRWLDRQAAPFFLWIHCFDPHHPYEPPEPFRSAYKDRLYDGEVAYVDHALGTFLGAVRDKKLFGNSIIIFTGDHGESLGQHGEETHGFFAYNSTLWIPLIICGPGIKPGRSDQQVGHTDIFPTVCDLLGVEKPSPLRGASLRPILEQKKLPQRAIYFESLYPYYSRGWAPIYGYLRGTEKYIDSPIPELYNMDRDFEESENLMAGKDVNLYREELARVTENLSPLETPAGGSRLDRQSLEKLKSLGYLTSPQASRKKTYGPRDDVKVLLPFHNKSLQAQGLYENGRKKEAVELLRSILAERNDVDIVYTDLAEIYEKEGRSADALDVLKRGVEILPANVRIVSMYIHFLNIAGRFDEVIRLITAGGQVSFEKIAESWNELGIAYMYKGDFRKAQGAFERALTLGEDDSAVYRNLGELFLNEFVENKAPGAYQKSLDAFKKALAANPRDALAHYGLGVALLKGENLAGAISRFAKALEIDPDYRDALYNLGLAYFRAGEYAKALPRLVSFKEKYSRLLNPDQLKTLDSLIEKCRQR